MSPATVELNKTAETGGVLSKKTVKSARVTYLQSLTAIRERCQTVYSATLASNPLSLFTVHEDRLDGVATRICELIARDYGVDEAALSGIPPHSRWRHFLPHGSVETQIINVLRAAGKSSIEIAKCVVDLFVVSVLMDAGAGAEWKYRREAEGLEVGRSEGLAMASMDMFLRGDFSSSKQAHPWRVDARGLDALDEALLRAGFQVNEQSNPLIGVAGRLELLKSLGRVLQCHESTYFAEERPSGLIDFLLRSGVQNGPTGALEVDMDRLWEVVIEGFGGVWPVSRTQLDGVSLGDVWPCALLASVNAVSVEDPKALMPFHKLSQWLTYSLIEPLEAIAGLRLRNKSLLTGLAEYRNGGLFIDAGVLELKADNSKPSQQLAFPPDHEAVVQWRALTVVLLDRTAELVRGRLGLTAEQFPLPKVLEAGTWKAGREIARKLRPLTGAPPINIVSDGTLF